MTTRPETPRGIVTQGRCTHQNDRSGGRPAYVVDVSALTPKSARLALRFLVPEPLLSDREQLDLALDRDVLNGGDTERVRVIRALLAGIEAANVPSRDR